MAPSGLTAGGREPARTTSARLAAGLLAVVLVQSAAAEPPARAPAAWPSEIELDGFALHADFDLQPYQELWRELPRLRRDVLTELRLAPAEETIHVFLFARKASYRAYLDRHFPAAPHRQALFIKQRGPGMIFAHFSADMATDLRHEGVHAVLHASLPMVPLWLDEGLAEYFEVEPARRAQRRDYLAAARRDALWRRSPDLMELEALENAGELDARDYRRAWQWAHFLLHGPGEVRDEFQAYLRDVARHVPPGRLSVRLHRRRSGLAEAFQEHWRSSW